jgi:UDP-N-acetylmuramoyl-tripeptide--D-alanyl-D-alanine ligase
MTPVSPEKLAQWSGGRWTAKPAAPILGFTQDTRTLRPGQLFVALKSQSRDGHDFLEAAAAAGAPAALVGRVSPALALPQLVVPDPLAAFQAIAGEHRRTFHGPVIGISGSAGKTSTKDLVALLLGGPPHVLATEGNRNNLLGVPLTLARIDPAVHRFAVVEAGISMPGEMKQLAAMIHPDLAIITLVAPAHLEELGDLEGVGREKADLPAVVGAAGIALFPRHCEQFGAFRDLAVKRLVVEAAAVVRPAPPPKDRVFYALTQRGDSTVLAVAYGSPQPLHFTLRRVSAGMAQNAVLAICAALWLGVPATVIQERLARWEPARLRGEWRRKGGKLVYVDCYNANPASMADAIANFNALVPAGQPRAYVLGCMEELGSRAAEYHKELGRTLCLGPNDRLYIVGDHAAALRDGVTEANPDFRQIAIADAAATVRPLLGRFSGAVFVKGSRRYHLEQVLDMEGDGC